MRGEGHFRGTRVLSGPLVVQCIAFLGPVEMFATPLCHGCLPPMHRKTCKEGPTIDFARKVDANAASHCSANPGTRVVTGSGGVRSLSTVGPTAP